MALGAASCAGGPVADEQPWFCRATGTDPEALLPLLRRRLVQTSGHAAAQVLRTDDWRGCWGNAALVLAMTAHPKAGRLIARRVDDVARASRDAVPLGDLGLLLYGWAGTARDADAAAISSTVDALAERANHQWWLERYPDGERLAARTGHAHDRARSALRALAFTGCRAAEAVLVGLRDAPESANQLDPDSRAELGQLITRNRARMGVSLR